jgi:large subunit ribosomal protein L25
MQVINVPAISRDSFGKGNIKNFRKSGSIPVVIYGSGENVHCGVKKNDVKSIVYTPEFKLAEIELDGAKHKCLLKDIQFHPVTDEIMHIDFYRLKDGVSFNTQVPVVCVGTSAGQREGGKLMQVIRKVRIKTTPEFLVNKLEVDITALNLGDSARVRDLQVGEGIQVMSPGAAPVASIEVPRALKSAEAAEEATEAAAPDAAAEAAAPAE